MFKCLVSFTLAVEAGGMHLCNERGWQPLSSPPLIVCLKEYYLVPGLLELLFDRLLLELGFGVVSFVVVFVFGRTLPLADSVDLPHTTCY